MGLIVLAMMLLRHLIEFVYFKNKVIIAQIALTMDALFPLPLI